MKITELTAIGLRIFAIYLFIYALRQAASLYSLIGEQPNSNQATVSILFYILWVGTPLIVSFGIWQFPQTATNLFLPKYKTDEIAPVTKSDLYIAAITIVGIFVLASAVPNTLEWITRLYMQSRMASAGFTFETSPDNKASIVSTTAELIIGLWLVFGSSGLFNIIDKAREWPNK